MILEHFLSILSFSIFLQISLFLFLTDKLWFYSELSHEELKANKLNEKSVARKK